MTTLNLEVAAGIDDADQSPVGPGPIDTGDDYIKIVTANDTTIRHGAARFTGITIPSGATIDSAFASLYFESQPNQGWLGVVYAEDTSDAVDFTTSATIVGRTKTTASVAWDTGSFSAEGRKTSPDIKSLVQELVDTYGGLSSAAILIIFWSDSAAPGYNAPLAVAFEHGDFVAGQRAQLDLTYTEAASGALLPQMMQHGLYA